MTTCAAAPTAGTARDVKLMLTNVVVILVRMGEPARTKCLGLSAIALPAMKEQAAKRKSTSVTRTPVNMGGTVPIFWAPTNASVPAGSGESIVKRTSTIAGTIPARMEATASTTLIHSSVYVNPLSPAVHVKQRWTHALQILVPMELSVVLMEIIETLPVPVQSGLRADTVTKTSTSALPLHRAGTMPLAEIPTAVMNASANMVSKVGTAW